VNSLFVQLGKLEGGERSIGDFNTWFTNARWVDRIFASAEFAPLVWAIDTLLLEYTSLDSEPGDSIDFALDVRDAIANAIVYPGRVRTTGTSPFVVIRSQTKATASALPRLRAVGGVRNRFVKRDLEGEPADFAIAV